MRFLKVILKNYTKINDISIENVQLFVINLYEMSFSLKLFRIFYYTLNE